MYLSRLTFTTLPGHTRQVEEKLRGLRDLVGQAGGTHVPALRTHFASLGAPDLVFEQEVPDLATLEQEIDDVVTNTAPCGVGSKVARCSDTTHRSADRQDAVRAV